MNTIFEEIENPLSQESQGNWRKIVQVGGAIVYIIVLFLTLAHNYNLIVNGVAQDVRWIATVGVIALELNAIILPLAIHHWTAASFHKTAAIIFYIGDLAILFANSLIDAQMVTNGVASLSPMARWYLVNFAEASPLYSLVVWSVLWMLDPTNRAKERTSMMVAHAQMSALEQVNSYIKSPEFQKIVAQQGSQIGRYVVGQAFKGNMFNSPPPEMEEEIVKMNGRNGNGHGNF